jgi:CubicO group peptidase (beta-lactamase class C family)
MDATAPTIRRAAGATAIFLVCLCGPFSVTRAESAPPQVDEVIVGRARDYVAAVNAGDAPAVRRLRDNDISGAFANSIPAGAFLQFFRNQHRVTGGEDFVDARVRTGTPNVVDVALRDHVYGQLHGLTLTFDGEADQRLSAFELADGAPSWAISHRGAMPPSWLAIRSRQMVQRGCRAGVFSGAVLVAHGGQVLVQEACGEASLRYHAKNDVETRFNLGSMNKMFTAVAVLQLVEAGKVSLTDPLSKYADEAWLPHDITGRITIEELLTHTSGLGSFFDDGWDKTPRDLYRELNDYKPLIRTEKLAFPPGTKFQYSDTGMFMLGVVIERASGENYFDYIRQHVYAPAHMNRTDCYPMNEPVENLATGYEYYSKGPYHWRENTFDDVFRGGPAGGGFSTVGDLFRFARALRSGKLLSPASVKLMWTDRSPNDYGAGFEVSNTAAGKVVGHSGFFEGVSGRLSIFVDRGYVVAVLSNIDNGAPALMDAIGDEIALSRRFQSSVALSSSPIPAA